MKKIDLYIIRKFLGTFFFTIALIIVIVIIFDVSEKIDDFIKNQAPLKEIIFSYYLTFIPFFTNMFSPLFTFIAVVYFTSRMAYNTEIIAILGSGVSFRRILYPYLFAASILMVMSFYLSNFLIPYTNKVKLKFENTYIFKTKFNNDYNIHVQNKPGEILYVESFNNIENRGYNFSMEKIGAKGLILKLKAESIYYDTLTKRWTITNFMLRTFHADGSETFTRGATIDTTFNVTPHDFSSFLQPVEIMNFIQIRHFIENEKIKGSENVKFYEVEKHKRLAFPVATLILTIIGASLSSRKLRGGIGLHLAFGIILSFSYIVFMQISTVFATFGTFSPALAVWIPNFIYSLLAIYLVRLAPK